MKKILTIFLFLLFPALLAFGATYNNLTLVNPMIIGGRAQGLTGVTASASSVPITGVTGLGAGVASAAASAVNTAGGLAALDSNAQIPGSAVAGMLTITCTTPAVNDTYIYNGTNLSCVHHPVAQSSASTAVTLDYTWVNTTTPNYSTGASAAVWTVPLSASMVGITVGDTVAIAQSGVGAVTVSGVSASVTILAEGDKKTTNGTSAVMMLKYLGSEIWRLFGNRVP